MVGVFMKKDKIFIIFSTILVAISFMFCVKIVDADSGWDSSYDSGGSWDSDSDWGYSSWDSDYSDGSSDLTLSEFIILFIIFVAFILVCSKFSTKYSTMGSKVVSDSSTRYRELTLDEINKIDETINKNDMNIKLFEIYKKIQIAWMNFDYDTLRKYTTDELFNMYNSQLKILSAKKQKNIMENISFINGKIIDITIENGIEEVKMYLQITMKDYVVDANNKVVRGNKNIINSIEYLITLTRNIEKENINKCPSCGAPIDIETGGICPYCDSNIVNNNQEFVMSKKECIGQKRVG
jgi:hypothetical protein